jgi:hypothetical protein
MKLQEQGKTEQARKDLGENSVTLADTLLLCFSPVWMYLCGSRMHMTTTTCSLSLHLEGTTVFSLLRKNMHHVEGGSLIQGTSVVKII